MTCVSISSAVLYEVWSSKTQVPIEYAAYQACAANCDKHYKNSPVAKNNDILNYETLLCHDEDRTCHTSPSLSCDSCRDEAETASDFKGIMQFFKIRSYGICATLGLLLCLLMYILNSYNVKASQSVFVFIFTIGILAWLAPDSYYLHKFSQNNAFDAMNPYFSPFENNELKPLWACWIVLEAVGLVLVCLAFACR
jgi:hypothetical protein